MDLAGRLCLPSGQVSVVGSIGSCQQVALRINTQAVILQHYVEELTA